MSHFGIHVCLPPGSEKNWRAAVDAAMAPYRIEDETGIGEWDHWSSSGDFWVRPAFVDEPSIVPSSQWPGDPMRCDGGPKPALDLAGMRAAATAERREMWAAWRESVHRHPVARSLDELRSEHPDARAANDAQPLIREVQARRRDGRDVLSRVSISGVDEVSYFGDDERRFLDSQARAAVTTYALPTVDGRWLDVEQTPDYEVLAWPYLDGLPDDAFVIELDCHG